MNIIAATIERLVRSEYGRPAPSHFQQAARELFHRMSKDMRESLEAEARKGQRTPLSKTAIGHFPIEDWDWGASPEPVLTSTVEHFKRELPLVVRPLPDAFAVNMPRNTYLTLARGAVHWYKDTPGPLTAYHLYLTPGQTKELRKTAEKWRRELFISTKYTSYALYETSWPWSWYGVDYTRTLYVSFGPIQVQEARKWAHFVVSFHISTRRTGKPPIGPDGKYELYAEPPVPPELTAEELAPHIAELEDVLAGKKSPTGSRALELLPPPLPEVNLNLAKERIAPGEWVPKKVPRDVSRLMHLIGQTRGIFSNYARIPDLDPLGEVAKAEAERLYAEGKKTGLAYGPDGKPKGFQHEGINSYKELLLRTREYRLVKGGREYVWRSYTSPGGHFFAIGFAWGGGAGSLSDEWTSKMEELWNAKRSEVLRDIEDCEQRPDLFNDEQKARLAELKAQVGKINKRLSELKLYRRGQDLMELIINEALSHKTTYGLHLAEGRVKDILYPGWHRSGLPENWRSLARQTLEALVSAYYMVTGKMENPNYERPHGPFLSLVADDERRGGWIVSMAPEYLGALYVFAVGPDPLDQGKQSLLLDWNKKLDKDERQKLKEEPTVPLSIRLTALRNLRAWSNSRRSLSTVLLDEITPNYEIRHTKKGRTHRTRVDNELGGTEKLYTFGGKTYHGANGNGGNGYRVGVWLSKVGCYSRRRGPRGSWEAFKTFLGDLRAVVIEALRGRTEPALEELESISYSDGLRMKLKIYIPADREHRLREILEKEAGLITPDDEAERIELEKAERHKRGEYTGKELQLARRMQGLTQAQLAEAWGIIRTRLTMIEAEQRPIPPELTEKVRLFVEKCHKDADKKGENVTGMPISTRKMSQESR